MQKVTPDSKTMGTLPDTQLGSPIKSLPQELLLHTFGFLSPKELGRASLVCRDWNAIASDNTLVTFKLAKLIQTKKVTLLDQKAWEAHIKNLADFGVDFSDAPILDNYKMQQLIDLVGSTEIEGDAGFSVIWMPKGTTFEILKELVRSSEGNSIEISGCLGSVDSYFKEKGPIEKTYIVALSNSVLKGSINAFDEMRALHDDITQKGCEMSGALETLAQIILTYKNSEASSPNRLHSVPDQHPLVMCSDTVDKYDTGDKYHLAIGFLSTEGTPIYVAIEFPNDLFCDMGMGIQKKLENHS